MTKKDKKFWESAALNNISFRHYYNMLTELAISMFEWKNLPDSVDPRFLELTLFTDGMAVFFKDDVLGFLALQVAVNGGFNVYRIPKKRRAYAVNGYQANLDEKNSVIIFNNYLHTDSRMAVEMYSHRLWDLDRAIDVNAKAQKTPVVIQCDETQRLTMLNLYKNYDGNEPFIFGDSGLNTNSVKALKTDAPFVADKLYTLKSQLLNEALTYIGISNVNTTKKERLITDEVARDQGSTIACRYSRLEARREACKAINKMYDLDTWCDYREGYQTIAEQVLTEGDGVTYEVV